MMPTIEEDAQDLAERAARDCPRCQRDQTQLLALTATEYGLPNMLKALPMPGRNAVPAVATLFAEALDHARHARYAQAAQPLTQAASTLARTMSQHAVEPGNPAWNALVALQQSTIALHALEGSTEDLRQSAATSARILACEPHLTAQALIFLDRQCQHGDAASQHHSPS